MTFKNQSDVHNFSSSYSLLFAQLSGVLYLSELYSFLQKSDAIQFAAANFARETVH